MGILTFLLSNKTLVIALILIAIIGGESFYIKIQKSHIATLQVEKKNLSDELAISVASVKSLQQAVSDQNIAIDKLKSDADARFIAHQEELAKAKTLATNYKNQAAELLKRKIPQNTTQCDAANQLINEEIQNAK
jgi:hypothetical protein